MPNKKAKQTKKVSDLNTGAVVEAIKKPKSKAKSKPAALKPSETPKVVKENNMFDTVVSDIRAEQQEDLIYIRNIMHTDGIAVLFGNHYFITDQANRGGGYSQLLKEDVAVRSVNLPVKVEKNPKFEFCHKNCRGNKRETCLEDCAELEARIMDWKLNTAGYSIVPFNSFEYYRNGMDDEYTPIEFHSYESFERIVVYYSKSILDIIDEFEHFIIPSLTIPKEQIGCLSKVDYFIEKYKTSKINKSMGLDSTKNLETELATAFAAGAKRDKAYKEKAARIKKINEEKVKENMQTTTQSEQQRIEELNLNLLKIEEINKLLGVKNV